MNARLVEMLTRLPGFLRVESVAAADGRGISISYWDSLETIKKWKADPVHQIAQTEGKARWYEDYTVEICEVLESYSKFPS